MDTIPTDRFYDDRVREMVLRNEETRSKEERCWVKESRTMPSHIMGPTQFWMEFLKQSVALSVAHERSNAADTLCTFVYQGQKGYRKFVVAHPEVYWWYNQDKAPEEMCSYEVIPEGAPCKLYLDLEYSIPLNPLSNGSRMTNTLINILCAYLLEYYGLPCNRTNVVNLDSSTDEKFSRHLIFTIRDIAFSDNQHVGRLINMICVDISDYTNRGMSCKVLDSIEKADVEELYVETKKGRMLFIDTGVYTKNRHFRLYKSTKWGKQAHLMLSEDSKYIPINECRDKETRIFLDSLVSYLPKRNALTLLDFDNNCTEGKRMGKGERKYTVRQESVVSQFPALDKYISNLINPGKIRVCKYFDESNTMVYEIVGNSPLLCLQILREH
ncbi:hypothetical protein KM043_003153 [Ampulex compressa]|nr:hypothetical protein KM043_003153 [Ampulex compressa]